VAVVGRNGCGKSTFLKILAATVGYDASPDDLSFSFNGKVTAPKNLRIAYVEQEPSAPSDLTVMDSILGISGSQSDEKSTDSLFGTVRRYRTAAAQAAEAPEEFTEASANMEKWNGAWDVLTRADEVATKLRVGHLQNQPLSKLSGGERKRVALAAALVQGPQVLICDEPTSFLSLAGVQWLTDLLNQDPNLTLLVVTHDRAFLGDVCNRVLELDNGSIYEYEGSYATYLEEKDARLQREQNVLQAAKNKYKMELAWMRKQPQARETKQKARIDAFYKLEKAMKPKPMDPSLTMSAEARRLGGKILSMRNVNLSFGDRCMLKDFSYDFIAGDRICLAGANGVGKTTFVRLLTEELSADSGTIEKGETIVMGVYDQTGIKIEDPEMTVLQFVIEAVQLREDVSLSEAAMAPDEARNLLRKFEFSKARWNERIGFLSGGERRRLQMLQVFSQKPNCLLADEISVDCDMDTLTALERFLQEFQGVLLLVSHDRSFADKVADHLFIFEGDGVIKDFQGTLSEYASTLVEIENEKVSNAAKKTGSSTTMQSDPKEDRNLRLAERNAVRKAKKEMDKVDKAMEKLRAKASSLQEELDDSADEGWTVLADLTAQLDKVNEQIDEKEMEWLELADIVESAEVEV
jgi:ATP-binding cassette subfamily F protein uup